MQLSFDYDSRANESVAYVGGDDETALYRVRMVRDEYPSNPFEEWDGNWPMVVRYDGHETEYGDMPCALSYFTDGQLIAKQSSICSAIGDEGAHHCYPARDIASDLAEYKADYRADYAKGRAGMASLLRDYFSDAIGNIAASDRFDMLESLYQLAGVPALATCSQGYCQGHYAELLIVATPEAQKAFGMGKAWARDSKRQLADMEGQADLYGAWAWGDVYGYICEFRPDPESEWEELEEIGSSVWGFYGSDPDKSGLAEQAASAIAYDMRQRRKARWQRLAELIKARVPLAIRAAILGEPEFTIAGAAA